jgi:hypothetical protein
MSRLYRVLVPLAASVACSSSFDPATLSLSGTTWRATFSFELGNATTHANEQCTGTVIIPIIGDTTAGREPEANLFTITQDANLSCGGRAPTRWWLADDVYFDIDRAEDSVFFVMPGAGGWFKASLKSAVRMEGGGPYYHGPGGLSIMGWPFTVTAVR